MTLCISKGSKRETRELDMQRFSLKKLASWKSGEKYKIKIQTGLHLWRTQMIVQTLTAPRIILEGISESELKRD